MLLICRFFGENLVCPARFERAAFGSASQRSIQLSYGHMLGRELKIVFYGVGLRIKFSSMYVRIHLGKFLLASL